MKSKQGKGCAYCNCQKPLTDDDFNGMRVDYVEGRPVIHGYVREKKFEALNHVICNLTEIQIKFLKTEMTAEIQYCPMCGRKLCEITWMN